MESFERFLSGLGSELSFGKTKAAWDTVLKYGLLDCSLVCTPSKGLYFCVNIFQAFILLSRRTLLT